MAVWPSSLSCCFCLAPARPVGAPLLQRTLCVGPPCGSLRLCESHLDRAGARSRLFPLPFTSCRHRPLPSLERHRQEGLARLPVRLPCVHVRRREAWGSYGLWPACSNLGSLPHSVPAGPCLPLGAHGIASVGGPPPQTIPLRRRLRAIRRLDPKFESQVLREGLGKPRCQRAQRLLKRGDPQSISARCPFFLQQLKPRLRLWKKALTAEELPPPLYPEVAFAGRSNAGKSTLLNELCGRSGTAAVSRRPGSTQSLFFFKAGSPCCLCLVDLPGYGYAEAEAAKRLQWTEMSLFYLKARPNLKRVFLLVDARWGLKASDICLLSFFERHRIPFQLVLTKADLPEQKSLIKILQIASEEVKKFKGCAGPPLAVSALRHRGLDPLRAEIEKLRLSKELVIGRLRLKAANLAEARRLKKEARKREKAMRSSPAAEQTKTTAVSGLAAASAPAEQEQPQGEQQAQALDNPVARALDRWGASIAGVASGLLSRRQTHGEDALAGDKLYGSAAAQDPTRAQGEGHTKLRPLGLASASPQAGAGAEALAGTEFDEEEVLALKEKNSLSSAVAAAVDRAAGTLPLPDISCAEALIRDLLPAPSRQTWQVHEPTPPQAEPSAEDLPEMSAGEMNPDAIPPLVPAPEVSHSRPLGEVARAHSDPADSTWAATVYQEIRLKPPKASDGSARLPSCGPQGVGLEGYTDWDASLKAPFPSAEVSALAVESLEQKEAQQQLSGEQNSSTAVQDHPWEAPARPASKRPLDLLRANDWRARRVGRAAVEIDMALRETQGIEDVYLTSCGDDDKSDALGRSPYLSGAGRELTPEAEGSSGALPDLGAVLSAQQRQQQQRQRQHSAYKGAGVRRLPSRASLGGAVFLDEETLAAEDLGCSITRARGRIGSPPDPSNYTGAHELDMQRSFDQKWRHELLPVGGVSPASNTGNNKAAERQGTAGGAQRKAGTSEDRAKPTKKRLALEILQQKAQEAHRPTDSSQGAEERNRRTADSLLFSAAQRRQERRLKELAKKTNTRQGRSKEMTWDVAYRKWARWARAHPALARESPRPSKAQLFADFRQKLEKKANRQRKMVHQKNPVAHARAAGGRSTPRQSIEEIRREAREVCLQEASR